MTNPTLHVNNVFIDQSGKIIKDKFHQSTMIGIKKVLRKNDTCVIALVIIYETKNKSNKSVLGVMLCPLFCHRELCLH